MLKLGKPLQIYNFIHTTHLTRLHLNIRHIITIFIQTFMFQCQGNVSCIDKDLDREIKPQDLIYCIHFVTIYINVQRPELPPVRPCFWIK